MNNAIIEMEQFLINSLKCKLFTIPYICKLQLTVGHKLCLSASARTDALLCLLMLRLDQELKGRLLLCLSKVWENGSKIRAAAFELMEKIVSFFNFTVPFTVTHRKLFQVFLFHQTLSLWVETCMCGGKDVFFRGHCTCSTSLQSL